MGDRVAHLRAKLARVEVNPYLALRGGKVVPVVGYTRDQVLARLTFTHEESDIEDEGSVTAKDGDRVIGEFEYGSLNEFAGTTVIDVNVHPDYRGLGVATKMLQVAEEHLGYPIRHSPRRTPEGEAWAQSLGAEKAERVIPQGQHTEPWKNS